MERIKRNLQGILKWCLQQQETPSTERENVDQENTESRYNWLREAMDSLVSGPTETELLKTAIGVLEFHSKNIDSLGDKERSDILESFEHIEYFVEDLDHASDLIPLNGVDVIVKYLYSNDNDLIVASSSIITNSCQNHQICQEAFNRTALTQLIKLLETNHSSLVKLKSLSAVSSIIRGYSSGRDMFFDQDGLELLLTSLKSESTKLVIKTCFLLSSLYTEPHSKLEEYGQRFSAAILGNLTRNEEDYNFIEQSLFALQSIVDQYPENLREIVTAKVSLKALSSSIEDEETRKVLEGLIEKCQL